MRSDPDGQFMRDDHMYFIAKMRTVHESAYCRPSAQEGAPISPTIRICLLATLTSRSTFGKTKRSSRPKRLSENRITK